MEKSSKIYVAGHNGLVGSALLRRLQSEGYTNLVVRTSKELDVRRQSDVEAFFEKERPDYVLLAAAKVGGIHANNTYKAEFIYDNIIIATNVIHTAYKYGVKKLLNLGSSCIYPKFAPQPVREDHLLTGNLEPTNEPYAIAKISAVKLCRYYNEQYGTNFISAMPTNLYGLNDNYDLETSHVLPDLIRKFHLAKLLLEGRYAEIGRDLRIFGNMPECILTTDYSSETDSLIIDHLSGFGIKMVSSKSSFSSILESQAPVCNSCSSNIKPLSSNSVVVQLWGSGNPYREFLHVDDAADGCVFLMENVDYKDIGECINLGTGEDLQIRSLAIIIKNIIGFEGEIVWDLSKPDGTPRKRLDTSRVNALGWSAKIKLEEGIKRCYQWYCSYSNRL